jgi:hypothetical protein
VGSITSCPPSELIVTGRTTATVLAAALVGVLVPGIAVLTGSTAPAGRVAPMASARPTTVPQVAPTVDVRADATSPTSTSVVVGPAPTTTSPAPTTTAPTTTSPAPTVPPPAPTLAEPVVTHVADIGVLSPRPVAAPVSVLLPSLGVDGFVLPAGVNPMNDLDVPPDAATLVWYRHGPTPGAIGSAVIAGHLNWRGERGVFADLAAVSVGDVVTVGYDDGSQRDFAVRAVELVPKPAVSVNGVFARRGERLLRLVTCGGEFDDATNHYRSNVIVTAAPL